MCVCVCVCMCVCVCVCIYIYIYIYIPFYIKRKIHFLGVIINLFQVIKIIIRYIFNISSWVFSNCFRRE